MLLYTRGDGPVLIQYSGHGLPYNAWLQSYRSHKGVMGGLLVRLLLLLLLLKLSTAAASPLYHLQHIREHPLHTEGLTLHSAYLPLHTAPLPCTLSVPCFTLCIPRYTLLSTLHAAACSFSALTTNCISFSTIS